MAEKYLDEEYSAGGYEHDEFDRIARERPLSGSHREEKKSHKWLIALIAVILLAPLVGIGVGYGLSEVRTGLAQEEQKENAQKIEKARQEEEKKAAEEEAAAKAKAEEEAKAAAEAAIKYDAAISVLNGAGIAGFAADNQKKLGDAGFSDVIADNYFSEDPAESTVYYMDSSLKATAEKVAATLGISEVVEDASATSSEVPITVVLRSDLAEAV